ncbi:MAG: hypothetical protein RL526_702 [Actinomycetota bacterium]
MQSDTAKPQVSFMANPLIRLICAGLFILTVTFTLRFFASGVETAPDYEAGQAGPEVIIEVQRGETGSEIGKKLEQAGVVKSTLAFFRVAVGDSRSARIAPGEHRLETRIPAKLALDQLLDPKRIPNLIIIRDGARVTEVVESLVQFGLAREDIERAMKAVTTPKIFSANSLEGFLYPAQYSFNKDVKAVTVIQAALEKFNWATKEVNWSVSNKFTPYELLTIASLVETEGTPDIFGKVSRVIFNRLQKGMPLQFDSTVHYALNRRGEIRVSLADIKVKSKYNTFTNAGLPPGPIGSPTRDAIDATLSPLEGDWLYFVTVKPGDTRFTSSYDRFLEWKAEYKKNFKQGLFE